MRARNLLGVLLGLLLSLPAHAAGMSIAMILCVLVGLAPDGPWPAATTNAFLISFALWQWLYLGPLVGWFYRRRPPMALGLALSALGGLAMSALLVLMAVLRR